MAFTLFDDQGVMQTGTLEECLHAVINWLDSDEASELYRSEEIDEAKKSFYGVLPSDEFEDVTILGFTIREV